MGESFSLMPAPNQHYAADIYFHSGRVVITLVIPLLSLLSRQEFNLSPFPFWPQSYKTNDGVHDKHTC